MSISVLLSDTSTAAGIDTVSVSVNASPDTMIKRAIELRSQINLFCSYTYKDDFKAEMQLNDDDWYILLHLAAALVHFENATMALQGQAKESQFGAMGECIPIIEALSLR